jgi:hypothetical protein
MIDFERNIMSKKIKIDINNKDTDYWDHVSLRYVLDEKIIRKYMDKLDMDLISQYQKLSEEFIREFSNEVDWYFISQSQKLSEDFIREFSNFVNWINISQYQRLSEDFIREFSNKINWYYISAYQKLSEDFIKEFSNKVDWYCIENCQKLSTGFMKKHKLKTTNSCWLYKDKEYKREYIKANTSYEIIGDKVIAYKSCRSDGYSYFNFQYRYKVGKEYECHANYNVAEQNSFGLSAWTKEQALEYHSTGKLFKVEIDLEDVAAIVGDGNKIRASKIKILEEIKI